jgi:hypothetical protein
MQRPEMEETTPRAFHFTSKAPSVELWISISSFFPFEFFLFGSTPEDRYMRLYPEEVQNQM